MYCIKNPIFNGANFPERFSKGYYVATMIAQEFSSMVMMESPCTISTFVILP
jgi:hypothetical protein